MSGIHREDVSKLRAVLKAADLLKAAAPRADLLERAVEGLTDEQIEAIPRLIAWFRWQDTDTVGEEMLDVIRLFHGAGS